jgi:hypothetical protein
MDFGGIYTDPFHSETSSNSSNIFHFTAPWLGGIRVIGNLTSNLANSKRFLLIGSDDGHHFWTLEGNFTDNDETISNLAIDFGPKAPGVGLLQGFYRPGAINFFSDSHGTVSNTWSRLVANSSFDLVDQTLHDAFNNFNGFYVDRAIFRPGSFVGIRFVSDRLGKFLRDEVCVIGTDDGRELWALEGGSFDKATCILHVGALSGTCHNGTIKFSDGTVWTKVALGTCDLHLLPRDVS